ncbi:DUF3800 domain-containing protein [Streptococcus mutans]|uniref:DUF3800 domain-containing protein n=1 Tax=Streptococcus mutans TaxID=1309 RepID=UPI0038BDDD2B
MGYYNFYYDESEHSREINHKTITANNYYDNFVTVFVGWDESKEELIKQKYLSFEQQYEGRKNKKGELKSESIKNRQLNKGFASTSKDNLQFIEDFLNLFDEDIHIQFSIISKVEYIVLQLFQNYRNSVMININFLCYSITKLILLYRPEGVLKSIYNDIQSFPQLLTDFCNERLVANEVNPELKQRENQILQEIILILEEVDENFKIDWNYDIAFWGFENYLNEKEIKDYFLTLDKEGEDNDPSKTLKAAQSVGFQNVQELESEKHFGLRMADMLAGLISKFLKALNKELQYKNQSDGTNKKLLSLKWFEVNERQLQLYKKLYYVITELNTAWYKAYAGNYSDNLITFIGFLEYINHFGTIQEIHELDFKMIPEYCNTHICQKLEWHFQRMNPNQKNNLDVEFVSDTEDYFFNKRGAKVYFDIEKQPILEIHANQKNLYSVLSIEFSKSMVPLVTVDNKGTPVCYRLPVELQEWAMTCVGLANMGDNLFPAQVVFNKIKGKIYVDIL